MQRIWIAGLLLAVAFSTGLLAHAGSQVVSANPGLDGEKCASPDADFTDDGFSCYNLYIKGQLENPANPKKVILGSMYIRMDGTTLDIHTVVTGGSTEYAEPQLCLDDDTSPINNLTSCTGAPAAGTNRDQASVFGGAGAGTLDCSVAEEAAGLYEFRVNNPGSAITDTPGGVDHNHIHIPNVSNCTEVSLHFNATGESIIGFGQPGVAEEDEEELTVSKTVETSYTRTHDWDISKRVVTENGAFHNDLPKIWLYTDGSGDETATWQIAVTYLGSQDSLHNVSGVITIENTGDLDATIESVVDELDGNIIDVDCGDATFPGYVLAIGDTLECTYSEDVDDKIEGENEVTVTTESGGEYNDVEPIVWGDPTTELYATIAVIDNGENLGTFTAPNGGRIVYSEPFAWEDYGQEGCGDHQIDNTATIVGFNGTTRVRLASASATLLVNVQCFEDETAWAANGNVPGSIRYTPRGNWATYVQYAVKCTTLFAGQTIDVGEVCFSAVDGDNMVTITVTLEGGNVFADVGENLKVEGYASAPSGNPAPGKFANKASCDTADQTCVIVVPAANYYGVHVDTWVPDPDFGP